MKKFLILGFVLLSGGLPVEAREAENEVNVRDRIREDLERDRNDISLVSEQEKLLFAEKIRIREDGDRSHWLLIDEMIMDRNCVLRNLVALRDLGFRFNIRQPDSLDDKIKKIIEDFMRMTNLSRQVVLQENYERRLGNNTEIKVKLKVPSKVIEMFKRLVRIVNSVGAGGTLNNIEFRDLIMYLSVAVSGSVNGKPLNYYRYEKKIGNIYEEKESTEELLETIAVMIDRLIRIFDEQAVNFLKDAILKLVYMNLQRP